MRKQITNISIIQSSKIVVILYSLFGFIYTLIGLPMIIFAPEKFKVMGIIYICMPILMAIFGFIFFALFSLVYNVLASWIGGIEFEVKDIE